MKIFLSTLLLLLTLSVNAQISISGYSFNSLGISYNQQGRLFGEVKFLPNSVEYLDEIAIEISGNYNILKFDCYDIYLGIGMNFEPFYGHPDPINGIVIPLGLQIFPIKESKNFSLIFEIAPKAFDELSIRHLWGIKYYFNNKKD